jgi:DNA adenine methylase
MAAIFALVSAPGHAMRHEEFFMYTRPFLKWLGGKFRILDQILCELPSGKRFVEPFAGSCAVYLNVNFHKALICDSNSDLINLYRHLQQEGENFIQYCSSFFTLENSTQTAYAMLRERLNSTTDTRERGALLLYMNRHAFNGLIRYNSKGGFNVAFGKYKKPYFPQDELRSFYRKTQTTATEFMAADFRTIFSQLEQGDVVYCDPPYFPLSESSNFTAYTGGVFSAHDQYDLATLVREAWRKGIYVVLSNQDTEFTRSLYSSAIRKYFSVQRFISCVGDNRRAAPELLAVYG